MKPVHSFTAVEDDGARLLILGSIPGKASLQAGEYYAHPRNAFWKIITEILGARGELSYAARLELLRRHEIALWDVLGSCVRPGSADSDIERDSIKANDFKKFFRAHPAVTRVFFNGAKAEECYKKYILPSLPAKCARLEYCRLPSTSPAYAALSQAAKLAIWKAAIAGK